MRIFIAILNLTILMTAQLANADVSETYTDRLNERN
jgi:hypothetical protein